MRWSAETLSARVLSLDRAMAITDYHKKEKKRKGKRDEPDSVCNLTLHTFSQPVPSVEVSEGERERRRTTEPFS
jgi:hypothetical protein